MDRDHHQIMAIMIRPSHGGYGNRSSRSADEDRQSPHFSYRTGTQMPRTTMKRTTSLGRATSSLSMIRATRRICRSIRTILSSSKHVPSLSQAPALTPVDDDDAETIKSRFSSRSRSRATHARKQQPQVSIAAAAAAKLHAQQVQRTTDKTKPSWLFQRQPKKLATKTGIDEHLEELEARTQAVLSNKKLQRLSSLEMETLLHDWNSSLKYISSDVKRLAPLVELVDQLVRHNHQQMSEIGEETTPKQQQASSRQQQDEFLAVYVGILAWARVSASAPHAAQRAQQLFELLTVPLFIPSDLQRNCVKHRRNVYHALLLAWSRCTLPQAPDKCRYWLEQMKREERSVFSFHHKLAHVHAYNRVMAAYASVGNVHQVEQLYKELQSRHIRPNAVTYDCWIKAYQVAGGGTSSSSQSAQEIFLQQLALYEKSKAYTAAQLRTRSASLKPLPLTLGRVLSIVVRQANDAPHHRARVILERALEFEHEHPECIGLVDLRAFAFVLQALTARDCVEQAEEVLSLLLQLYESSHRDHLRPNRMVFGMVMDGYAQRQTTDSLAKVESILTSLEDRLVKVLNNNPNEDDDDPEAVAVDCAVYNILMTAYLRTWPDDAVSKIQGTIARMEQVAKQYRKPKVRPDCISYTILMQALVKQGDAEFPLEVEKLLERMLKDTREVGRPQLQSYNVALDAWAKSDNTSALDRVTEILDSMESPPDTSCYNVLLNAYAKRGRAEDALHLLERMKAQRGSFLNLHCRPDNVTYSSVLHALGSSSRIYKRWEKALACVDDMIQSYQQGDSSCRPSQRTIATLLHVLRTSDDVRDKHVAAREVLQRLEPLGLQQGPVTAIAMIVACGETQGSKECRLEAVLFVLEILNSLDHGSGKQVNSEVFRAVLESCHKLLDSGDDKDHLLVKVFQQCAASGHVSLPVLQSLRKICPPDVYLMLTTQDGRKTPDINAIPEEWKRNLLYRSD